MTTRLFAACFAVLSVFTFGCGGDATIIEDGLDEETLASNLVTDRTWKAPNLKVTAHIRTFSTDAYMRELDAHPQVSHNFFRRMAMKATLSFINDSANYEPPTSFTATGWANWKASREYRGFTHLSDFTATCKSGVVTSFTWPRTESSPGYTPSGSSYSMGSELISTGTFWPGLTVAKTQANKCVKLTDRRASRMNDSDRSKHRLAFDYDAPFIYSDVSSELCCDGTNQVTVSGSAFPTRRVFLGDRMVKEVAQSGWANFIVSGGKEKQPSGRGFLAPGGLIYSSRLLAQ